MHVNVGPRCQGDMNPDQPLILRVLMTLHFEIPCIWVTYNMPF